jgi:AcrR family transcriptional regulator
MGVSRWEPNAKGRLSEAALDLFVARGYDQTTVADIAAAAGLTERTFFRHFTDKREVLFWGGELLEHQLVDGTLAAPPTAAPLDAVAAGLRSACPWFDGRRARSRRRQTVIDGHSELQERELIKMARLTDALAGALRTRGVPDPPAAMAAEVGIAAFRRAWARWVGAARGPALATLLDEHLAALREVAGA